MEALKASKVLCHLCPHNSVSVYSDTGFEMHVKAYHPTRQPISVTLAKAREHTRDVAVVEAKQTIVSINDTMKVCYIFIQNISHLQN